MNWVDQVIADFSPGDAGVWVVATMLAVYIIREWRETRKLSLDDRIARRDGYARQVEMLMSENRALRGDLSRLHDEYEQYRQMRQRETDQLRDMIINLQNEVAGLKRRVATDAIELARLKGVEGIL